ncbi:MAG TPA: hypothetical protein VMZ91_15830 [Candidatus Paceibacterota bacterium]|nr:hypothetical protein [Candidatus Paceibacterota bacterium]
MNKAIKIAGLIIGLGSVICNTIILIKNYPVVIGLTRFIPEPNQFIRIPELIMGFFGIVVLGLMLCGELK